MSGRNAAAARNAATRRPAFLPTAARLFVGGVLLYAGFPKLGAPGEFAEAVAAYRLGEYLGAFGTVAVQATAVVLPWVEVTAGLLLLAGLWIRAAGLAALALFSVFTLAVISALARGLDIDCGCFGTAAATPLGWRTLGLDLLCWVPSLFLVFFAPEEPRRDAKKITASPPRPEAAPIDDQV